LFWGFPGSEDGLARRRSKVELYEEIRREYGTVPHTTGR
jgi:hypothetical protein